MQNNKETKTAEQEQPRSTIEKWIREKLLADASVEELELMFTALGADEHFLNELVEIGSIGRRPADFEITLVTGKAKRKKTFDTGGYLLTINGGNGEPTCLVLGSIADRDHRRALSDNPKEPVFVEIVPGEEYYTVKVGGRDSFRHLLTLGQATETGGLLDLKITEIIGEILMDRESFRRYITGGSRRAGPDPEFPRPRSIPTPPPLRPSSRR